MNKKGNIYFGVAIGIFLYLSGVLFLPFILDDIDTTRNDLGCSDFSTISDGTKLMCLGISGITPYFIWFFFSTGLAYIIGRKT